MTYLLMNVGIIIAIILFNSLKFIPASRRNLQMSKIAIIRGVSLFSLICMLFVLSGCGEYNGLGGLGMGGGTGFFSQGSVDLSWQKPTTNSDGSTLNDLNGFKVYYGTSSRNYSKSINVGNNSSVTIGDLTPGTWYFAVTAFDHTGNESGYSNELNSVIN